MQNEFAKDFAPERSSDAVQLYAYALLGMAATIFFLALFLHTPIGTEARDYVFYRGYLAQAGSWRDLVYPVGSNRRLVSMVAFALSRDACGFGATCLNVVQIVQLLLCVFFGAVHLHQLLRRPVLVACCMALWCVSLPVFAVGFWQATQHDKLAFLFSLAALSFGFSAMRRGVRGGGLAISTTLLLALFVLALNSKEIAFFLPVAAVAQIALLGASGSLRQRVQAARVYLLPLAYAVIFIGTYLVRLNSAWQGHVMGGDVATNAQFYFLGVMGRQHSSAVSSLAALAILVAATVYALMAKGGAAADDGRPMSGALRVAAYLSVVLGANLILVAGALFPDDFYLFLAEWAFFGLLATAFVTLLHAERWTRYVGLGALAVLLLIFVHKRAGDMFGWGSGEVLRESRVLSADYQRLRPYCGAQMAQGMTFIFPERPLGIFFFFRGGTDGPDQLLPAFICEDGKPSPMTYRYDAAAPPATPGSVQVSFNPNLSIRDISKK